MTFLEPLRLLLLLAVAGLAAWYVVLQVRRRAYAVRFTNVALLDKVAPKRPGWRRHLAAAAFLLTLASAVTAFARPVRDEQVPRERATIVMAIDVSASMLAEDVTPTRLEAAKDAAVSFLDELPDRFNVGLVAFSGVAGVRVPPTTDRDAVRRGILALDIGPGTAIGEAIFASLGALETLPGGDAAEPVPARIVLMSDGETTTGRSNEEGVAAAIDAEVPVSTIAFGTPDGVVTYEGQTVPVPVNGPALEAVAQSTGGAYFEAQTGDELERVYEDISSSIGYVEEQRDVSAWFVGSAIVLGLAAGVLSLLFGSRLP